jgi:hypothetical protein
MFAMVVFGGIGTAFADSIYSFTTIDVPGATATAVTGINGSGQIVGWFGSPPSGLARGFVDTGGSFTTIDVPGTTVTQALRINDSGQIVGHLHAVFTDGVFVADDTDVAKAQGFD